MHQPELFQAGDHPDMIVEAPTGSFVVAPLVPAPRAGWIGPAAGEWVLEGSAIIDRHPYDELNYVLDGELHVTAAGVTVVAPAGSLVRVRAGVAAEYRSVGRSRMVYVYGDNPRGLPSELLHELPS